MTRARRVPDRAGSHGEQRETYRPLTRCLRLSVAGQDQSKPQMPLASQAESASSILVTRSRIYPQVDDPGVLCCPDQHVLEGGARTSQEGVSGVGPKAVPPMALCRFLEILYP